MTEKSDMAVTNRSGISITTLSEAARMADAVYKSGMVPASLNSPEKVLVAAQVGMEAGLTFMAAVKSIYVVKGTPAWRGSAAKGLILNKGVCESWTQGWEGKDDSRYAWVKSKRKGMADVNETRFDVATAKRMGLWGKSDPWRGDSDNMLMWRAIGRHCDQWYSDVLLGMPLAEVARDKDWVDPNINDLPPSVGEPDGLLAQLEAPKEETEPAPEEPVEAEFEPVEPEPPKEEKPKRRSNLPPSPEYLADVVTPIVAKYNEGRTENMATLEALIGTVKDGATDIYALNKKQLESLIELIQEEEATQLF